MKKIFFLLLIVLFFSINSDAQYNSVLSEGNWYKISTSENGIYKLEYSHLVELGLDMNNLKIQDISIYGNGNGMLPKLNSDFRYQDLTQNSVQYFDNNNNGIFDPLDFILFYGQSPDKWVYDLDSELFTYQQHLFSDEVYYYLHWHNEQYEEKIIEQKPILVNYTSHITSFHDFLCHESEIENLIQSGSKWFGERFDYDETQSFNFLFPNLETASLMSIKLSVAARSITPSTFVLKSNNIELTSLIVENISTLYAQEYAKEASKMVQFNSNSSNINIGLEYSSSDNGASAWLDYIEINAKRRLIMHGDKMFFRSPVDVIDEIGNFQLQNGVGLIVWDISDPTNVFEISTTMNGTTLVFNDSLNKRNEYIAFNSSSYLQPTLHQSVENQNLHNISTDVEYIIVSHPDFIFAANRLADFHQYYDGMSVIVVTPMQIYNEFSSGMQDVTAIRDFVRHQYKKTSSKLKYLLLFGDGSYDPKDRIQNNTNYIPTYQSKNSTHPIKTYVTDDYFAFLDSYEGDFINDEDGTDSVDIGVGRLPASSKEEAEMLVDKIEHYYSKDSFGSWRNDIAFIADDCDPPHSPGQTSSPFFTKDADDLSEFLDQNYPNLNTAKIYLESFPQESTPGGPRSESTQHAINNKIKKGALLINYTGHGSTLGWAQERILEIDQIQGWDNLNKLSLFMTATCKFSYFDDPENKSAGEHVLMNPQGGAIALVSTTRLVSSGENSQLNTKFTDVLFKKTDGNFPRLGDIFKKTKQAMANESTTNHFNFTLLGDPALRLNYPEFDVVTTIIEDTLKALGETIIEGSIMNNGILISDFNGTIYPTVYDKKITRSTLGEDDCTEKMFYDEQNNIIYKGAASVINGKFSFSFIVPKDIAYHYGKGKISYYAVSEDVQPIDASGSYESVVIGGISENIIYDYSPAEISLFMNNRAFVNGGMTNQDPVLIADIHDISGINTVGNGIGHDITAILDGDDVSPYILNDFYESNKDDFTKGTIQFPFYDIEEGEHRITLKVWDVFNNSSEATITFFVTDKENIVVTDYVCYPNPFSNKTEFYFWHNKSNQELNVILEIYSISGMLVRKIENNYISPGYRIGPIAWDGRDNFGEKMSAGVYIAQLKVNSEDGDFIKKSNRVILLPR